MLKTAIATAFLAFVSTGAHAQSREILIMGGPNHDEFLGCLTCSEFDSNSVWNDFSRHGFGNEFGTWNRFGQHASKFSTSSACNEYATRGPVLVDRSGNFYGRLSVNRFAQDSVCGPNGVEQLCMALRVMCSDD
jgi:hypothetical protein